MNQNLLYIITLVVFVLGLVISIYLIIQKKLIETKLEKNKLEEDKIINSENLLKVRGYKPKRKKKISYFFNLNGKYAEVVLRPDFIAMKNFKKYVAVINDSDKGITENSLLRKTVTEFYYSGYFYGILIVDPVKQEIDKIIYINKKDKINQKLYKILVIIIFVLLTITVFFTMNFLDKKVI